MQKNDYVCYLYILVLLIMNTPQNSIIDLSKLSDKDIESLKNFYDFLIHRKKEDVKKNETKAGFGVGKLPDSFYNPIKVEKFLAFEREEIYGRE